MSACGRGRFRGSSGRNGFLGWNRLIRFRRLLGWRRLRLGWLVLLLRLMVSLVIY